MAIARRTAARYAEAADLAGLGLPVRALATVPPYFGPVTLTGSGAATMTPGGFPAGVYDLRVRVSTAGALGSAAVEVSTNGGTSYGSPLAVPSSGLVTVPSTSSSFASGLTLAFSGALVLADVYACDAASSVERALDEPEFNAAFERWSAVCDADGRHDWPGLQALIQRTAEVDGEVLIRLRPRRREDGLPIPLQLQVLEIDWLDSSRNGVIDGEEVVNGIAYSALGKPAGYYLWDRHPGDLTSMRSRRTGSTRVDARNILHYFDPQRPGQGRGFSNLASIIARTRDVQTYEDAELARKNQESRLGVLASGDLSQMENPPTSAADSPIGDLGELPSGSIVGLPAGVNLQLVEPKAVPGHVDYLKYNLHVIAAGWGIPYELMTGDVGETSYSSARVNLLNFRRRVQAQQWLCIMPRLIVPICRAAEDAAVLGGVIPRAEYAYDHSVPKWEYVNPEQDVDADLKEIWGGMSSISEKLRQRGYTDASQVFDELGRDMQRLEATGALPLLLALAGKAQPAEPKQGTTP